MAYRLIGQDCAITLTDLGNFAAWAAGGSGTPIAVQGFAKSIKIEDKANTVDTRGMGDLRKKSRPTYGETSITVDLLIESTGTFGTTVGNIMQIVFAPLFNGGTLTYTGVVTANSLDAQMDQAQMQTLTIECDVDNV